MLSCSLRRVVFRSFRPPDRRFGGFCGAVDVRARFRGNVASALGEEITRQFDFGIFAGLRAVPHFEWNWIHDSRSDGAARPRAMSLSSVGFLKDYRPHRGHNTSLRIWGFFLSLNSTATVVKPRNTARSLALHRIAPQECKASSKWFTLPKCARCGSIVSRVFNFA